MTISTLLLVTAAAAAILALWCHVRWPSAAPKTFRASVVRVVIGFALLQGSVVVLHWAAGVSLAAVLVSFVGVIVPTLTFAFLVSLWLMKFFADTLRGFV